MVAYSFRPQFAEPIATLAKRQTVRADRKRHARPGERLQLYTGMRTRQCRKLLDIDPVCIDVRPIEIELGDRQLRTPTGWTHFVYEIVIDGIALTPTEIENFAVADGFGVNGAADGAAAERMGQFWYHNHGLDRFRGVVIRWEPR